MCVGCMLSASSSDTKSEDAIGDGKKSQERNFSPKRKFLGRTSRGHPGVIRADIPTQNFGQGAQNPGKNKHLGADIHDPKARTSTTLRDSQKLRSEKLWAEFSFPKQGEGNLTKDTPLKKRVMVQQLPRVTSIG